MNIWQLLKLFTAVIVLIPASGFAAEAASNAGGFDSAILGIVTTLATAAIASAVKSWADVAVLKSEVERLEKDVDAAADKTIVQASLDRIEKRLDSMDARIRVVCQVA